MLRQLRVLFNVLIGRETPQTHSSGGRKDVERVGEEMLKRRRLHGDRSTGPARLYGKTSSGDKVHIHALGGSHSVFLCGAKPGLGLLSSIPPVDRSELCTNCLNLLERGAS